MAKSSKVVKSVKATVKKKATPKPAASKKVVATKAAPKKTTSKKSVVKKTTPAKTTVKAKTPAKKIVAKKAAKKTIPSKKAASKKVIVKKKSAPKKAVPAKKIKEQAIPVEATTIVEPVKKPEENEINTPEGIITNTDQNADPIPEENDDKLIFSGQQPGQNWMPDATKASPHDPYHGNTNPSKAKTSMKPSGKKPLWDSRK